MFMLMPRLGENLIPEAEVFAKPEVRRASWAELTFFLLFLPSRAIPRHLYFVVAELTSMSQADQALWNTVLHNITLPAA